MNFVFFVVRSVFLAERIYNVDNSIRVFPNDVETIPLEKLPLLDLHAKHVDLAKQFDKYLLLIFLRHLA